MYSQPTDGDSSRGGEEGSNSAARKSTKQHVCPQCKKFFSRPSSLKTHLNSHTGDKPYKCGYPGCDMAFAATSNARRHRRLHGDKFAREYKPEKEIEFCSPVVSDSVELPNSQRSSSKKGLKWMPSKVPRENVSRKIDLQSGESSTEPSRYISMGSLKNN
ncbi:hypothetical protein BD626DRAFT_548633 [Schizophyllum amplum]|uniref:C2H2-type domain-containing protein n=1 Tax=Schizophyllum amplum TaxID=97359 RepID=A0A550CBQ9_9AGAR|nr:hypothetical protein BD626DRAFT_548633 [Auriculariopsis ampla]